VHVYNNDFEKGLRASHLHLGESSSPSAAIIGANETDMIPPTADSRLFVLFCKGSLCFFLLGVALTGDADARREKYFLRAPHGNLSRRVESARGDYLLNEEF
jgi:hypothetical protein